MGWDIASRAIPGLEWVLKVDTNLNPGLGWVFNGISRGTGYSWDHFVGWDIRGITQWRIR